MPTAINTYAGDQLLVRDVLVTAALELWEALQVPTSNELLDELLQDFNAACMLYAALHGPKMRAALS